MIHDIHITGKKGAPGELVRHADMEIKIPLTAKEWNVYVLSNPNNGRGSLIAFPSKV